MPRWLTEIAAFFALLFSWLTGRPSRGAMAAQDGATRRFIIIQIDGLAHEYLLQALARGYAPTLQRFMAQGYRLQRWRCGLPSSTPAVQAGLMYGDNWDIPAFRWYEKDTGLAPHCKSPFFAERIKERASDGRIGILAGGSSYTNLLDGDARLALFTLSSMGRQRFFEHLRGLGWALLFALIPWRIVRIVALIIWELVRDIVRTVVVWIRSGFRRRLTLIKPVLQVLTNVFLPEIQTFGVLLDVYRGMPSVYVNYYGYDEVAHGDGALGPEAVRALRRIDGHVGQIERLRRVYRPDAHLYILSDHGMSPAIPIDRVDPKQPLGKFVAGALAASVAFDEALAQPPPFAGDQAGPSPGSAPGSRPSEVSTIDDSYRWLVDELDGVEMRLSPRGRRLAKALRKRLIDRLPPDPDSEYDLARGADVVVRVSGNVAHLYFNVTRGKMDVSEIALLYGDLLDALNHHPGVGLVLAVEDGRPVIITSSGTVGLTAGRLPPGLAEPQQSAADLARLLTFPHSGDLVVIGAWNLRGRVVTFENQNATHGGIGGPQEYPFFLTPPGSALDVTHVTNASQIYDFFIREYPPRPAAATGAAEEDAGAEDVVAAEAVTAEGPASQGTASDAPASGEAVTASSDAPATPPQ